MTKVTMYTDGACSGNPGPAGWAAILVSGKHEKEVVGGTAESTNNRAEIMAVIVGLQALKFTCRATILTDSQYVIGVLSLGWKRKVNHDVLSQADALLAKHDVTFVKVKGHNGNEMNERCDQAARAEAERQQSRDAYDEYHAAQPEYCDGTCHNCMVEAMIEAAQVRSPKQPYEDYGICDRCYKRMVGEELQRSRERSEFIVYCDNCFENHGAWR